MVFEPSTWAVSPQHRRWSTRCSGGWSPRSSELFRRPEFRRRVAGDGERSRRVDVTGRLEVPPGRLRLSWPKLDKEALGVRHQCPVVVQASAGPALAALDPVDGGVYLELHIERGDGAVIDLEIRGSGHLGKARIGRPPQDLVKEQGQRATVCGAVATQMELAERGAATDMIIGDLVPDERDQHGITSTREVDPSSGRPFPLRSGPGLEQVNGRLYPACAFVPH